MDYAFTHENKVYTPNLTKLDAAEAQAHNRALTEAELAHWRNAPDRHYGYVTDSPLITTWTGETLGTITVRKTQRNNFGQRETRIVMRGNNGAFYWGRFGSDWSQLVRLHKYHA